MSKAQNGQIVKVHYTGKLEDGTVFDTSDGRDPLQFTLGGGQIIPGFEEGVIGMQPGESKTITISADEAYGPHHDELVLEVERNQFPPHLEPKVGQQLELHQEDGRTIDVIVTDASQESVTLDANHPLAGQDLVFDVQLVEIV